MAASLFCAYLLGNPARHCLEESSTRPIRLAEGTAMPLDPDLAKLDQQYNSLADAVDSGSMDYQSAAAALERMRAVDGAGNVWGMNDRGEFVCAPPGGTPTPTDPAQFVPLRGGPGLAGPPQELRQTPPPSDSWGGEWAPAPSQPGGGPWSSGPGTPQEWGTGQQDQQWGSSPSSGQGEPDWAQPPGIGINPPPWAGDLGGVADDEWSSPGQNLPGQAGDPRTGRRLPTPGGRSSARRIPELPSFNLAWVRKHRRVVVVGVVVLVLLILALVGSGHHAPTSSTGSAASTPATSPAAAPNSAVPPTARVTTVLASLASGSATQASSVVANPGTPAQVQLEVATFLGYAQLHLHINPSAATQSSGGATQTWELISSAGTQIATTTVSWSDTGGAWKLTTWPKFNA